jgi:hypothetical protein
MSLVCILLVAGVTTVGATITNDGAPPWSWLGALRGKRISHSILRHHRRVSAGEIDWGKILGGLALYGVLLIAHEWVISFTPFP